jgi:phenylacetate-CoA ligase
VLSTADSSAAQTTIWDPEHECASRVDLVALQLTRLKGTLERVYATVPHYKRAFDAAGVLPEDLRTLDDLRRFPFLTKSDLRDEFPYGLFATPMSEVVRLHASSGTTGRPTVVGYTRSDLSTWSNLVARVAVAAGACASDIAQISFGYGLFTGAFGLHYGLELIGATVLPVSGGNTERQVEIMSMFKPTVLVCTPSYALHVAEVANRMGYGPKELSLRLGLFGAEPWSESMRREIEDKLGVSATDNYGLSEVVGPGVSGECSHKHGLHISEDHFLVEVVSPDTLEPVKPGEQGELVFTSLTKEALPVIRYRTRDISRLIPEPCPCGRTTIRMERVSGRTDDMLIIRGVNVFPSQIESVLLEIEGVAPHYQIEVDRQGALDEVTLHVEVTPSAFSDEARRVIEMRDRVQRRLATVLGISIRVRLAEPGTIERSAGKAKRVIDRRLR